MRNIFLVNESSIVGQQELLAVMAALQLQVNRDFGPLWGIDAQLQIAGRYDSSQEALVILDNTDQVDALGYHTVASRGLPIGFVFASTCRQYNTPWSSCLSHELLEQLADPYCNLIVDAGWGGKAVGVAREVADPTEADPYLIHGVSVSNFVTPAWFDQDAAQLRLDYLYLIQTPLNLRPGGYVSLYRNGHWTQVVDQQKPVSEYRLDKGVQRYSRKGRR